MTAYTVRITDRREVAESTMAFYFEKPEGFQFRAGQYLNLSLIDPPETDDEGNMRVFSIARAPLEENLMVATRMRDTAFKRVLKTIPPGTGVKIAGPFGSFTLHDDASCPAVFLAGGIGITPFLSILRQAYRAKLPHRLYLFYSNRRPEDTAFLQQLQQMERENTNYKFIGVMTQVEKSKVRWTGETGHIDKGMLARHINDLSAPIYYVAGPPPMVVALREMLDGVGVSGDHIRTEEFAGY